MTEWNGRPPSGAKPFSAHLLRNKRTIRGFPAIWHDYMWSGTYGGFDPGHAAKFYEYVGPLLTPAEVEAKVAEAVKAEREACARVAQDVADKGTPDHRVRMAAIAVRDAIRTRETSE